MTELKTLNEIKAEDDFGRNCFSVRNGQRELVAKDRLKQEAIKRIKNCHDGCSENLRCKACKRDMWFYDIKEEELK